MTELLAITAVWLQSVLRRLPVTIHAIYVEYGDAFTPDMEHQVCFNAFGFESLAGGQFDPTIADHVGELGNFTWEPPEECSFRADGHPGVDWLAVLRAAAQTPGVLALAAELEIQLLVGEHDGEVYIIR